MLLIVIKRVSAIKVKKDEKMCLLSLSRHILNINFSSYNVNEERKNEGVFFKWSFKEGNKCRLANHISHDFAFV